MSFSGITRRPAFWIIQALFFLISSGLAIHLYPQAFPVIELQIKMDRAAALKAAATLLRENHWVPRDFKQAARFELDDEAQTFIELTQGGSTAFAKVLKEGLYSPYTWKVRNYAEGETSETVVRFTPEGKFYAFGEKLSEDEPGASLKASEAQIIAEEGAKRFGVKFSEYELVEKSQEIKPSHRLDHSFVYERLNAKLGEGRYRLILGISGNRLVRLSHFIKIPDAFLRHYAEMRSSNDTIAVVSSAAIAIFYFLGGGILGLFLLAKKRWVVWRMPLICAVVVGGFQFLEQLNHLPLLWMDYDTALSSVGFLVRYLFSSFGMFIFEVMMLTVSFTAAESLTRCAYPQHPQLWKIWTVGNASTYNILGRTLGGYFSLGFFFLYVVVIYLVGARYLGWWSPSDTLFHPDVLATYCPWFTSISNSLHAGFWEESLFRAVPLAVVALLGNHFGGRKKWITFGLVVQALVFASAHANYPAQPSYARVVELIFPSLVFGGFYLAFGLLPGIILHFIFDTVSFALPLFAADTPGIWLERGMVILCAFIPLWLVLFSRIKTKKWIWLPLSELNGAWKPPIAAQTGQQMGAKELRDPDTQASRDKKFSLPASYFLYEKIVLLLGAFAVVLGLFFYHLDNQAPRLEVDRHQAIGIARNALVQQGVLLPPAWSVGAFISEGSDQEEDFVWKTGGGGIYRKLLGNYLSPPGWLVRFFRFDTDVAERAEEFQVFIYNSGEVYRIRHEIPEGRAIHSLSEEDARNVALTALKKINGIDPSSLKLRSSTPAKLPARTDWYFVFSNLAITLPHGGEARISVRVAGNLVASMRRFIFIPENWAREERNRQNSIGVIRGLSGLFVAFILLAGIGVSLKKWMLHTTSFQAFWRGFGILFILELINLLNSLPVKLAQFSTEGPRLNQWVSLVSLSVIKMLFVSGFLAIVLGYVLKILRLQPRLHDLVGIRIGYSIGIVSAFLVAGVSYLLPSLEPLKGKLGPMNGFIPWLYGVQAVINYTVFTLFFLLIGIALQNLTQGWKIRRGLASLLLLFLGFILSGLQLEELSHGLVMGACIGLVLILVYRFVLKSTLRLVPLITAGAFIFSGLKEMNLNAFSGSSWVWGIALFLVVGISGYLTSFNKGFES